jgi:hypothetical protein
MAKQHELREAVVALMGTHGETGLFRAVADEMDLRLVRAYGNAQRLRGVVQAAQRLREGGHYEDSPEWVAWDDMAKKALGRMEVEDG